MLVLLVSMDWGISWRGLRSVRLIRDDKGQAGCLLFMMCRGMARARMVG